MDAVFFQELGLRKPDYTLSIGSRPPAAQVAGIAEGVENIILATYPDWVIVHGDTNTTLGGALAAVKQKHTGLRLAHVEAGARSFNLDQPEELNRILVDRMSDLLFAPTEIDARNLRNEGLSEESILITGNTVADSCRRMAGLINGEVPNGLTRDGYVLATIHRQETVDNPDTLREVWKAMSSIALTVPVVLPIHPRARKMVDRENLRTDVPGLKIINPVGYREMIILLKNARFCMTDSGGVQEEAALLSVPALLLRDQTEHRRYVESGQHVLSGTSCQSIFKEAQRLFDPHELERRRRLGATPDIGVSKKILNALIK
jgi:UDP-N-acetylglucosamine 2-epimerase